MFGKKLQRIEPIDEPLPEDEASRTSEEGISLEELSNAYAIAMHSQMQGEDSITQTAQSRESDELVRTSSDEVPATAPSEIPLAAPKVSDSDEVAITMEGVLEAILFMGGTGSNILAADRLLSGFRSVTEQELDRCIESLNSKYRQQGRAYTIVRERGGFRMTLVSEMEAARQVFYAKVKEVQLQQAAIDCLALIAYNQGITREELDSLWGNPSASQVAMLIRKELVRCERSEEKKAMVYYTTERFLEVSDLDSLNDLPREE